MESGKLEIVPNVGVHFRSIERFIEKLDRGPYGGEYQRSIATYAVNVGRLEQVSSERGFSFSPDHSQEFILEECSRLADIFAGPGHQFASSIATYELLAPLLKRLVGTLGGNPERYASCLYLDGRPSSAVAFLNSIPEEHKPFVSGFAGPLRDLVQSAS